MTEQRTVPMSRRRLLTMIGTGAGSSAMYQAMTTLGLAAESTYEGPIRLEGDPRGASVLIRTNLRSGSPRNWIAPGKSLGRYT